MPRAAPVLHVTVDAATNRFTGVNFSYDANGNLSYGGSVDANYNYDIENRMVTQWNPNTVTSESYSYGPDKLRVWKRRTDGSEQVTFYGLRGERMDMFQPISSSSGVLTGGGDLLYFAGRPVSYGADRLGSKRADSPNTQGQTIAYTYFPYGEEYSTTTQDADKFGTYYRDSSTLDYARNRFYSNRLARFMTADPYRNSAGPADPGSWNRYAYVGNDPVNWYDPAGLQAEAPPVSGCYINGLWWPTEFCGSPQGAPSKTPLDPPPLTSRQAWMLAKGFQRRVKSGTLSDCEALAEFAQDAAEVSRTNDQFVKDFGVLVPKTLAANIGLKYWNSSSVPLNTGQASGYATLYQNTIPDNPKTGWNGDQGHHFAAFFEFGYEHPDLGFFVSGAFEGLEAWLKGQKLNMGDVALGMAAAQLGADLRAGMINMGDVVSAILNEICKH